MADQSQFELRVVAVDGRYTMLSVVVDHETTEIGLVDRQGCPLAESARLILNVFMAASKKYP